MASTSSSAMSTVVVRGVGLRRGGRAAAVPRRVRSSARSRRRCRGSPVPDPRDDRGLRARTVRCTRVTAASGVRSSCDTSATKRRIRCSDVAQVRLRRVAFGECLVDPVEHRVQRGRRAGRPRCRRPAPGARCVTCRRRRRSQVRSVRRVAVAAGLPGRGASRRRLRSRAHRLRRRTRSGAAGPGIR